MHLLDRPTPAERGGSVKETSCMTKNVNRRDFMSAAAVSGMALAPIKAQVASDTPALLGGRKIRNEPFPSWPVVAETDEKAVAAVVRSARWGRFPGGNVDRFEEKFRGFIGAAGSVATTLNGAAVCQAVSSRTLVESE